MPYAYMQRVALPQSDVRQVKLILITAHSTPFHVAVIAEQPAAKRVAQSNIVRYNRLTHYQTKPGKRIQPVYPQSYLLHIVAIRRNGTHVKRQRVVLLPPGYGSMLIPVENSFTVARHESCRNRKYRYNSSDIIP